MMKKIFFSLSFVVLAVLSTMSLASCSSDDDDYVVAGAVPSPTLTDVNGNKLRVTSVGYDWFEYDETWKLTRFGGYNDTYELKGDAFAFDIEDGVTCNIAMNRQGLISRVSLALNEKTENSRYAKFSASYDIRYNSERQLVSCSGYFDCEEYDRESKISYSEHETGNITNTWSNGNLTKSVTNVTYTGNEDGKQFNEKESSTITFHYGNQLNVFRQFPLDMAVEVLPEDMCLFAAIGLYGVGPVNLPTGCTYIDYDDGYEAESGEDTYKFILNENGSIYSEQINHYTPSVYKYETGTRAAVAQDAVAKSLLSAFKDGRLFKHAKRKK